MAYILLIVLWHSYLNVYYIFYILEKNIVLKYKEAMNEANKTEQNQKE